ncbi:hypothetical protein B2J93_4819 [Marssonina coronariae]|uniref:Uncharacterized protein n=1 Tax=Diplocarpon coronariae TaxID=2795749 RepID=A0A218YZ56_9HELO|nr:hypothetical protein B2J93_4819 [Marssonina coronariae]
MGSKRRFGWRKAAASLPVYRRIESTQMALRGRAVLLCAAQQHENGSVAGDVRVRVMMTVTEQTSDAQRRAGMEGPANSEQQPVKDDDLQAPSHDR